MIVDFKCQLDWFRGCPTIWLNSISGYVSMRMFSDEISIWTSCLRRLPFLMWVDIIKYFGGLNRKGRGRRNLPLLFCLPFWTETSYLMFSYPKTGIYTSGFPGSQAFKCVLSYTTVSKSPCGTWQLVGLLSLCNYVSQFLILNRCIYHLSIHPVSPENPG